MPITRKYLCDCGWEFTQLHWDRNDPVPDCPACTSASARSIPGSFAIRTNASRAGDAAYQMAEETYGVTDMRDNLREGDTAFKGPAPVQTAEAEQLTRAMKDAMPDLSEKQAAEVNNFWVKGMQPEQSQAISAQAQQASAISRADGADAMAMLHQGERAAGGGMNLEVVGRAKIEDA